MKTDFSINVQVNIGVTPEAVQLVTAILTKTPPVAIPATSEQPAPNGDQSPTPAATGTRKAKAEESTDTGKEQEAEVVATEAPTAEEQPAEAPETSEPKELTEQDIREAIHRTRQRIEGEDYKNNTDSEGYKKYHKQLTATFKNIAALFGSDKPSTLPADKRESFIEQCEELVVENGEITTKCPY